MKDWISWSEGGEWKPIKILWENLAYVPNQTQRASPLTRSRQYSYRKVIAPQNRIRKLRHKSVQANPRAESDTYTCTTKHRAKRTDLNENMNTSYFGDRELLQWINRAAQQATCLPTAKKSRSKIEVRWHKTEREQRTPAPLAGWISRYNRNQEPGRSIKTITDEARTAESDRHTGRKRRPRESTGLSIEEERGTEKLR
jgi:hypothetical protein